MAMAATSSLFFPSSTRSSFLSPFPSLPSKSLLAGRISCRTPEFPSFHGECEENKSLKAALLTSNGGKRTGGRMRPAEDKMKKEPEWKKEDNGNAGDETGTENDDSGEGVSDTESQGDSK